MCRFLNKMFIENANKLNGNPATDLWELYRDLPKFPTNTHFAGIQRATTKRGNLAADGISFTRKRHRCRIFPEKLSLVSTSSPTSPHALLRGSIQLPFHLCIIRSSKDWYYHRLQVPRPLSINVPFWLVGIGIQSPVSQSSDLKVVNKKKQFM